LFEQFALEDGCWRSNTKTLALLKKRDLVGILAGEIQLVGDNDNRVAVGGGEAAQSFEEIDLRADIEMEGGLVEKEQQRLLRESAGEDDALFFAAGDLIHEAVAEMFGADLGEGIARDGDVFFGFEAESAAVGMTTLKNKLPGVRRKEQRTFLLDHGDTLATGAVGKSMRDEAVEENAAGEGMKGAGDKFQ
jgi:hypothetical protein